MGKKTVSEIIIHGKSDGTKGVFARRWRSAWRKGAREIGRKERKEEGRETRWNHAISLNDGWTKYGGV